jgi:histidinol-phosphate phosphatase family protein
MRQPYVFLDRDDTLIVDKPYLRNPAGIEFTPRALEGLRRLRAAGYGLVLVTNQAGIGRGLLTEDDLAAVHARLRELLAQQDLALDAIYYCPHHPQDGCGCRKPATGMLEQACRDFAVDVAQSAMIGDSDADIRLGRAFGLTTIQLRLDGSRPNHGADFLAADLVEAADWLLNRPRRS